MNDYDLQMFNLVVSHIRMIQNDTECYSMIQDDGLVKININIGLIIISYFHFQQLCLYSYVLACFAAQVNLGGCSDLASNQQHLNLLINSPAL